MHKHALVALFFLFFSMSAAVAQEASTADNATASTSRPQGEAGETKIALDIPAQNLNDALQAVAVASHHKLLYSSELVDGKNSPAIKGQYTAEQAVRQLLTGTGLQCEIKDGLVLIRARDASTTSLALNAGPLRLVQAEQAAAEESSDPTSEAPPEKLEEFETSLTRMPEILVKGSRASLNADIERTEDDVQPYVVFSAEEVQRSMAMNVEDFLKNRLPMNTSRSTNRQNTHTGSNVSEFNLRGLGPDETLVLINGRRRAGVSNIANSSSNSRESSNNNFGQPDVNGIPLSSIERIEVLPATAAGIYGGGATGGVINIVLKTNFSGLDVMANYANTFDTDSAVKRLSATGGMTLEGGKTSITFSASYSEQNEMLVRDRDFTQRARQLQLKAVEDNPNYFDSGFVEVPVSYTTNIRSNEPNDDGETFKHLVLKNPINGITDIGSGHTYIPVGYTGDIQQLIDNAGSFNLDLANDVNNAGRSIQNSPRTHSVDLTVNRQFSDSFSMFVNLSRAEDHGSVLTGGLSNTGSIDADAPNNPFTSEIMVSFPLPGFAFPQIFDSETRDAVVGAALRLPLRWQAQIEGSWSQSRTFSKGGTPFLDGDLQDPSDGSIIRTGVNTNIRTGMIDVLRDLNQSPLDLTEFALPFPNDGMDPADSIGTGALLRLSGPLFKLPAGDVTLSALLDHRRNEAKETITRGYTDFLGGNVYYFFPSRQATTDSYYLEANAPLVSSLNERPWLRMLEVQATVRRDSTKTRSVPTGSIQISGPGDRPDSVTYTDSTDTATGYTLGFRAAPIQDVALRMSFSHGFLPPSIAQIGPTTIVANPSSPNGGFDPLRLDERIGIHGDATVIEGGNPNLKSELSDSISTGLVLTPRFLQGVRLSVDYTQIKKTDEVSGIDFDLLIRQPQLYPGRVVRGPSLGDGLPGPITYLDTTLINIDRSTVKAFDLQLDYSLPTDRAGSFNFYAVATKQTESSRRLTVTSPVVNSVGFRDGPLRWRGNVGIDWHRGALALGWNMQYFASYLVYSSDDVASGNTLGIDLAIAAQGSRAIPSQSYHDLSFKYWLGDGAFSRIHAFQGLVISGGIQNVLNTSPPIDIADGDVGYSSYGDPLLRRYALQLTKSF